MSSLEGFERLLAQGRDNALLRYSLGNAYLKAGRSAEAVEQLREAVRQDAGHSASWKLLGKALQDTGDLAAALQAYRDGIVVAEQRGDLQAAREMAVFARRVEKTLASPPPDSA